MIAIEPSSLYPTSVTPNTILPTHLTILGVRSCAFQREREREREREGDRETGRSLVPAWRSWRPFDAPSNLKPEGLIVLSNQIFRF